VGSGDQYVSWISIDDLADLILFVLREESLMGPVNAVAPHPVTNRELTKNLGRVVRRPTAMTLPTFAARLAFGGVADELLLASARVNPTKLMGAGYRFRHPRVETALRHVLGREQAGE
jgi:NAD dependent epimerase/dehydratase family enzyme